MHTPYSGRFVALWFTFQQLIPWRSTFRPQPSSLDYLSRTNAALSCCGARNSGGASPSLAERRGDRLGQAVEVEVVGVGAEGVFYRAGENLQADQNVRVDHRQWDRPRA